MKCPVCLGKEKLPIYSTIKITQMKSKETYENTKAIIREGGKKYAVQYKQQPCPHCKSNRTNETKR